jgi:hypothetical protein
VICNWMIDEGWEVPDIWARVPSMSEVSWKDIILSVFALSLRIVTEYGYVVFKFEKNESLCVEVGTIISLLLCSTSQSLTFYNIE